MREGENREAAIIGYSDCVHVHPSDPANALVVFDARILIQGRGGERVLAAQDFFRAPDKTDLRMNVLESGEIITAIELPLVGENTRSAYEKAMDRATWAFALASAAAKVEIRDSRLETVGICLGGVAPTPWREVRIEKTLSGMNADERMVTQELDNGLEEASPLEHNGYKRRLARAMAKRAMRRCLA
jgi:xanthine dehydrogenase YagS FAD-binding subunit